MKFYILHNIAWLNKGLWSIVVATGLLFSGGAQATVDTSPALFDTMASGPLNCTEGESVPLIAGGDITIGDVSCQFDASGSVVTITYKTNDPWCMTETNLIVADDIEDVPTNKAGNPVIGAFSKEGGVSETLSCSQVASYPLPVPDGCGVEPPIPDGKLVIVAHAVVKNYSGDLPCPWGEGCPQGDISLVYTGKKVDLDSFFGITVSSADPEDCDGGPYKGWCVDVTTGIDPGKSPYHCKFYNTIDDVGLIPAGLITDVETLDSVNWLLNQDMVGEPYVYDPNPALEPQTSNCIGYPDLNNPDHVDPDGNYDYRMGDVQVGIWEMVNGVGEIGPGQGTYNPCRANELYRQAMYYGEGFTPEDCDQTVAILCETVDENCASVRAQPTIFEVPYPCGAETAWGEGFEIVPDGKSWAMYFEASCPVPSE